MATCKWVLFHLFNILPLQFLLEEIPAVLVKLSGLCSPIHL